MASACASDLVDSSLPSSLALFTPPYSVEQYIAHESVLHEVWRLVALPGYPVHLSIFHNNYANDSAAETRSKRSKGLPVSVLRTNSSEMFTLFVR